MPGITEGARPRRILTVCKGNHCRAPLAAAVLAKHGGSAVEDRCAGLRDLLLYLGDRDVPDPWEQPGEAFTACVAVIEAGALRNLTAT